ncbi:hypothetical protein HMPREF1545_01915 [Oscillibacter sp. KLE 1728]|nr:hypothetical protein HMPREF1545_01915 [Oscillibacter sp. KLE 1728]ERK63184.1 hypothetical protein HMPREF1546_02289 [Oscillibacter sp. KLE 1745]
MCVDSSRLVCRYRRFEAGTLRPVRKGAFPDVEILPNHCGFCQKAKQAAENPASKARFTS